LRCGFALGSTLALQSISFEFEGEHPDHRERIDLTVGLCDDPVIAGKSTLLSFLAIVSVFDRDLGVEDALSLVAGQAQDASYGWYETPKRFEVSMIEIDGSREGRT